MDKFIYDRGELLYEGKTKRIWRAFGYPKLVIIENKKNITAHDDPNFTKEFETKAIHATNTTCRVFELLKSAGIPVAYINQLSPTEFLAPRCEMIGLEVVGRRYAVGSYTKRNPQLAKEKGAAPHRFHRLMVEFFLKTTGGEFIGLSGEKQVEGLDPQKGEEDPLIQDPYAPVWALYHPKKPAWEVGSALNKAIFKKEVTATQINKLEAILRKVFLVLEGAWASLGHRLIDFKIEFGLTTQGDVSELYVADVIDNDSWRLRSQNWEEFSKQAFREGESLSEVERKYGIVERLVQQFRIPKQALVFWRGSDKDDFPKLPENMVPTAVFVEEITISGHKAPQHSLNRLEEILTNHPDGGVIIVKVGMSNGLGPILAARTSWPVISIPASVKDFPEDVWSSLRMPSSVPMATIPNETNAINYALNILAQKNPIIYMQRQFEIERLDF